MPISPLTIVGTWAPTVVCKEDAGQPVLLQLPAKKPDSEKRHEMVAETRNVLDPRAERRDRHDRGWLLEFTGRGRLVRGRPGAQRHRLRHDSRRRAGDLRAARDEQQAP